MTWTVRNTLRGTLELHGFSNQGEPVRIPGGEIFDLDTLSPVRKDIESSRQIQVAFKEGYLKTLNRDGMVAAEPVVRQADEASVEPWQQALIQQLSEQGQQIQRLTEALNHLVSQLKSQVGTREASPVALSLDEDKLARSLGQQLSGVLASAAPAGAPQAAAQPRGQSQDAVARAKLLERVGEDMETQFNPSETLGVTTYVDTQQTANMVDLLSNLDRNDQ